MTLAANRSHRWRLPRATATLAGIAVAASSWVALAPAAQADIGLSVTPTTVTKVAPHATTALDGLAVSGAAVDADIQVTVGTDVGTLTVNDTTGVTLAFGNNASGDASVSFNGVPADVNNALGSIDLVTGDDAGSEATVSLSAMPYTDGLVYSSDNGHFYQFVDAPGLTWDAAEADAATQSFAGQSGYLASIPSRAVNDLITSKIQGAENVWIGAEATDDPTGTPARVWKWADGPLAGSTISSCTNWIDVCDFTPASGGFAGWAWGEPNNAGAGAEPHSGEWVAVTNWFGPYGEWNDLPSDTGFAIAGYVVEYGDLPDGSTGFASVVETSSTIDVRGVPTPPLNPMASAGDESALVQWDVPANDGGSPITGYTVSVAPGGATVDCASSPCVVPGLTNGTTYTFTVIATNAEGDSAPSDPTSITPGLGIPTPRDLEVTTGDRVMTLSFDLGVTKRSPAITGFGYSLDRGKTWHHLSTHWHATRVPAPTLTGQVEGVLNGKTYRVMVRAKTSRGVGPASRAVSATPTMWFHDPLTTQARRHLKPVPAHPTGYRGKVARTKAFAASRNGTPAFPAAGLEGRQLQQREAVSFAAGEMFRFDSASVTPKGRREIRSVVASLGYVRSVTCEGYSDYGGTAANEWRLSRGRAAAVCRLLKEYGADVVTKARSFGPTRPAVIGGSTAARDDNRRVVLLVTG